MLEKRIRGASAPQCAIPQSNFRKISHKAVFQRAVCKPRID
jgi:hypothetical protein